MVLSSESVLGRVLRRALLILTASAGPLALCFDQANSDASRQHRPAARSTSPSMTEEQKIAMAVQAAPREIGKNATVQEMEHMSGGKRKTLRTGTNGWVCYLLADEKPMCLDQEWQKWMQAYMDKKKPEITRVGFAYMLTGDKGGSNTDPYAAAPTAENQWVVAPAHLMILFPDPKMLEGYSTDPRNGGPWKMFKDTPYAHLMVPVDRAHSAVLISR